MPVGNSKQKVFCRIFHWIEAHDADFAVAISRVCMEGYLSVGRNKVGVTFLYPKEDIRAQIKKAAMSGDFDVATSLIGSHIIPAFLEKASDAELILGTKHGVALTAKSSGKNITIGSVEIKPTSFKGTGPISVWEVESGEMPLEGAEFNWRASQKKVTGRGHTRGGSVAPLRSVVARRLERSFSADISQGSLGETHVYAASMAGLLNYLKTVDPSLLKKIILHLDHDPVASFYIAVQPYKSSGHLISNDVIAAWGGRSMINMTGSAYKRIFDECASAALEGLATPEEYNTYVGNLRSVVMDRPAIAAVPFLKNAAIKLMNENNINGKKIFPDGGTVSGEHQLWCDEIRFIIGTCMLGLGNTSLDHASNWGQIVNMLNVLRKGDNYGEETSFTNPKTYRESVSSKSEVAMFESMVNSTDFLSRGAPSNKLLDPNGNNEMVGGNITKFDPKQSGGIYATGWEKCKQVGSFGNTPMWGMALIDAIKNHPDKANIKEQICNN